MNRKTLVIMILTLFLGVALGAGGTLGAQKFLFKTPEISAKAAETTKKTGPLMPIGDFTVNLQGGNFLKTSITVQVTDEKAVVHLKEGDAFLKDRVNTVLANKSLMNVQTSDAREALRAELINKLNEVADNKITDVLFLSLVYQ
ncbi:flagellar basal body-associated protein FliL [Desulfosporosinus sp. BICA1-9]|uniref:flagellar basal body-associated FliL family protein n=1 Tax=Desulfosporosinus sp. BICA1-9 TaxID=1531958 RepID=UPI00054C5215|nr:flagellar basal body-associated FliL family protein [Desulfosporosinus sp. BICA1-9]KJS47738.1 MAG: flagellar basal body protein FliL [Peptococcaceae bacterium BRH_c23]KJS90023.1 MAG: flagellar basal body protein FliL [Desulfosporosinus sp. BICA1-9]HBW36431.1 flagellar basal body protein FliL [Desulfosporosinus sp.]